MYRLTNYFKFMFIRHPLTRLVSGFREKFNNRTDPHDRAFYHLIPKIYNYSHKAGKPLGRKSEVNISFTDFVTFLFSPERKGMQRNEHWNTITHLCSPCEVMYDFIGEHEHFVRDTNYLLSTVFNSKKSIPAPRRPTKTDKTDALKYFHKVPKKLLLKAIDFYIMISLISNKIDSIHLYEPVYH